MCLLPASFALVKFDNFHDLSQLLVVLFVIFELTCNLFVHISILQSLSTVFGAFSDSVMTTVWTNLPAGLDSYGHVNICP